MFYRLSESLMRIMGDPSDGGTVWVILYAAYTVPFIGLMVQKRRHIKIRRMGVTAVKSKRSALMGAWVLRTVNISRRLFKAR